MPTRRDWEQRDADEKSKAYQSRTGALAKRLARVSQKASQDMISFMETILEDFRYEGGFRTKAEAESWLRMRMDMAAWEDLVDWITKVGDKATKRKLEAKVSAWTAGREFSRMDALNTALQANQAILQEAVKTSTLPILVDVSTDAYYRQMFSIQKGLGVGWKLDALPGNWVTVAASSKLDATSMYFAKHVTGLFKAKLLDGILKGRSSKQIAKDLEESGTPAPVAMMTARTSITETAAETEKKALERAKLDKYEFMATLDERTCPECGRLDGKVFYTKDGKKGVNMPPMHPNCRCIITAALTDEYKGDKRFARDSKGKGIYVDGRMTYEEWRKIYIDSESKS